MAIVGCAPAWDSKEISTPWENASSGAHGTVTPIASAYSKDGMSCRNVLASYVRRQGSETWLQGEACRVKAGAWEVKSLPALVAVLDRESVAV